MPPESFNHVTIFPDLSYNLSYKEKNLSTEQVGPFAMGDVNPYGKYFVGQSYRNMLAKGEVPIGNVTFEPGCRNNWHIHHADKGGGQILLRTAGNGWYQEWGKPAQAPRDGDVVQIPAGVNHWHGAATKPARDL